MASKKKILTEQAIDHIVDYKHSKTINYTLEDIRLLINEEFGLNMKSNSAISRAYTKRMEQASTSQSTHKTMKTVQKTSNNPHGFVLHGAKKTK